MERKKKIQNDRRKTERVRIVMCRGCDLSVGRRRHQFTVENISLLGEERKETILQEQARVGVVERRDQVKTGSEYVSVNGMLESFFV